MNRRYAWFMLAGLLLLLLPIIALADTVYLKDGSKVIGDITSETNTEVTIQSSMGTIIVPRDRILSILYEHSQPASNELASDINWETHKDIGGWGLLAAWGATVAGSAAMGDGYFGTTAIPIVGPLVTISRVESDPNAEYLSGGKGLLIASCVVQVGLATYFIVSWAKDSNSRKSKSLSVHPSSKHVGVSVTFSF